MKNDTTPDADTLGSEFSIVLREWLTPEQLREIDRLNAAEPEGSSVCHSHDFCDANEAMIEALGRFNIEPDLQDETQIALINAAWDSAKAVGFSNKAD